MKKELKFCSQKDIQNLQMDEDILEVKIKGRVA